MSHFKTTLPKYTEFFWILQKVPELAPGWEWKYLSWFYREQAERYQKAPKSSILLHKREINLYLYHKSFVILTCCLLIETCWKQSLADLFCFQLIFQLIQAPLLSVHSQGHLTASGNLLLLRAMSQPWPHSTLPAFFSLLINSPISSVAVSPSQTCSVSFRKEVFSFSH